MNNPYTPPTLLRNGHVQTILCGTAPRRQLLKKRSQQLVKNAESVILECHDGIKLQGFYTPNPSTDLSTARGLVITIHGWEGCSESLYNLSVGSHLLSKGFSVFRLNLRDHGGTQHLNPLPFNSTRLREVVNAVEQIQRLFPQKNNYLCGFSLGGNFALRVAVAAQKAEIQLNRVVAVCPVLDPINTMQTLEQGLPVYHQYFTERWKSSLSRKLALFPELNYGETLLKQNSLRSMMEYFAPLCTDYSDAVSYLKGYAITENRLKNLTVPCHIITSKDDPVVSWLDLQRLAKSDLLTIELSEYGGHCGFFSDYKLNSWLDHRIDTLFN